MASERSVGCRAQHVVDVKTLFAQHSPNAALFCSFVFPEQGTTSILIEISTVNKSTRRNECHRCLNYFKPCPFSSYVIPENVFFIIILNTALTMYPII